MTSGRLIGATISALSSPRTQCGTITFSVCTFSCPSAFIASCAHAIACSSAGEPDSRLPMWSVRCWSFA